MIEHPMSTTVDDLTLSVRELSPAESAYMEETEHYFDAHETVTLDGIEGFLHHGSIPWPRTGEYRDHRYTLTFPSENLEITVGFGQDDCVSTARRILLSVHMEDS